MSDKRRHHSTKNTSVVTFRYPSGPPVTVHVHGRRSEVTNEIRTNMEKYKRKMSFWDLQTAKNVVVDLENVDTWSVK